MPEPEKLERDPPETEMSLTVKSEEASERVKLIVGVSPLLREARLELMAILGGVVSAATVLIERVTELLASEPSALVLPAESEKAPDATEMRASEVLPVVGVRVAE